MRRKIYSMLIVSAMLLTMAGCAKPAEPVANEETAVVSEVQEEPVVEDTTEAIADTVEDAVTADEVEAAVEEEVDKEATETVEDTVEAEADTLDEDATVEETTVEGAGEDKAEGNEEAKEEATETDTSAADTSKTEESKTEEKKTNIPEWFDASYYAANNSDVVAAVGNSADALYNHYVNHGKAEGRKANADDPAERVVADNTGNESNQSSGGSGNSGSGNWWDNYERDVWYDCGNCFFLLMDRNEIIDTTTQEQILNERYPDPNDSYNGMGAVAFGTFVGTMGPNSPRVVYVFLAGRADSNFPAGFWDTV